MTIGERQGIIAWTRARVLLRGVVGGGLWGLCDQAIISATNFLTTIVIARALNPTAFGAFALAYAAIQMANNMQAALVTQPHNVLGATRAGEAYVRYTTVTALSQVCFSGVVALVALGGAMVAAIAGWGITTLLVALTFALVAWQFQEFVRRVLYTEERLAAAFVNDLISYGLQAAGIVALASVGRLTGASALLMAGLTSAIAAAYGAWVLRSRLRYRDVRSLRFADGIAENWRFGRWLFGTVLASWASDEIYPVLVGAFVNIAATGTLRAVQTIMGPTHILFRAMSVSLTPRAARIYAAEGYGALRAFVRRVTLLTAPIMLTYCLLIALFSRVILRLLYGDRYAQYGWLLALLALSYALIYLRMPAIIALEARGISAPVFQAYLWLTLAVLTIGVALVHTLGLVGAALGLVGNGIVLNIVLWWSYRRAAEPDVPVVSVEDAAGRHPREKETVTP